MKLLLDTNAYVALKQGHAEVSRLVRDAAELVFSAVVVGELMFGFRNGTRYTRNLAELDELLAHPRVTLLSVSRTTAERFGRIAAALRKAGKPIPSNDVWIAAQTFESGAELLSFDGHFALVPGLVWTRLAR